MTRLEEVHQKLIEGVIGVTKTGLMRFKKRGCRNSNQTQMIGPIFSLVRLWSRTWTSLWPTGDRNVSMG
jgi:hypothetical protein